MTEQYIELSPTEIQLGFVASCIEFAARKLCCPYEEVYLRMKRVGLIEGFLYPYYDTLHTQSREYVTEAVIECLTNWENQKKPCV